MTYFPKDKLENDFLRACYVMLKSEKIPSIYDLNKIQVVKLAGELRNHGKETAAVNLFQTAKTILAQGIT